MQSADLEVIKDIPGYKVILKTVLRSQIQQLVEQLALHTDEESVILTASVTDGTLCHLGSESGKSFLENHDDVKSQFLGYCLKIADASACISQQCSLYLPELLEFCFNVHKASLKEMSKANSKDPDERVPVGDLSSGSALFASTTKVVVEYHSKQADSDKDTIAGGLGYTATSPYMTQPPRFSPGYAQPQRPRGQHPLTFTRAPSNYRPEPYPRNRPGRKNPTSRPAAAKTATGDIKSEPVEGELDDGFGQSASTSHGLSPAQSLSDTRPDLSDKGDESNLSAPSDNPMGDIGEDTLNNSELAGLSLGADFSSLVPGGTTSDNNDVSDQNSMVPGSSRANSSLSGGEYDPNVKVEAVSESELDLEVTGMEQGAGGSQQEGWAPAEGVVYDSTGATGNQADMGGDQGYKPNPTKSLLPKTSRKPRKRLEDIQFGSGVKLNDAPPATPAKGVDDVEPSSGFGLDNSQSAPAFGLDDTQSASTVAPPINDVQMSSSGFGLDNSNTNVRLDDVQTVAGLRLDDFLPIPGGRLDDAPTMVGKRFDDPLLQVNKTLDSLFPMAAAKRAEESSKPGGGMKNPFLGVNQGGKAMYPCFFCGKVFTHRGNFEIHLRIHTGEKPFACDVCEQRFARKDRLKFHMFSAHQKHLP